MRVGILPTAGPLEPLIRAGLYQHRDCLGGENAADEKEQEFRFQKDRDGAECSSDRKTPSWWSIGALRFFAGDCVQVRGARSRRTTSMWSFWPMTCLECWSSSG